MIFSERPRTTSLPALSTGFWNTRLNTRISRHLETTQSGCWGEDRFVCVALNTLHLTNMLLFGAQLSSVSLAASLTGLEVSGCYWWTLCSWKIDNPSCHSAADRQGRVGYTAEYIAPVSQNEHKDLFKLTDANVLRDNVWIVFCASPVVLTLFLSHSVWAEACSFLAARAKHGWISSRKNGHGSCEEPLHKMAIVFSQAHPLEMTAQRVSSGRVTYRRLDVVFLFCFIELLSAVGFRLHSVLLVHLDDISFSLESFWALMGL